MEKSGEFNNMNNIFINAYFGKPYKTRSGMKAIYIGSTYKNDHALHIDKNGSNFSNDIYNDNGKMVNNKRQADTPYDIISECQEEVVCKCQWQDYYDYRIMMQNGEGHVRVSFFKDKIVISDLFVVEEQRHKGYATILLNKVDELLKGQKAVIYPIEEWHRKWYEKRGYIIGKE